MDDPDPVVSNLKDDLDEDADWQDIIAAEAEVYLAKQAAFAAAFPPPPDD